MTAVGMARPQAYTITATDTDMNRRTVCRAAVVGLTAGLAGCASFDDEDAESPDEHGEPTDDPQPDDEPIDTGMNDDATDPTDRIDSERVAGATFIDTEDCSDPETATVEFLDSEVEALITGCIEGRNGCAVPIFLGGHDDNGTLRVEIGEVDFSDDETMCTQQIVQLGYELRLRFDELPEAIDVFHDGAAESGVVTTARP